MPTTKTGFWVRVENNEVKDVWDTPPDNRPGWREAIEIHPDLTPNREIYHTHFIDITQNPVQIVWSTRPITPDDRKLSLQHQAENEYSRVIHEQEMFKLMNDPNRPFEQSAIDAAKVTMDARIAQINTCVTHEDVDAIM